MIDINKLPIVKKAYKVDNRIFEEDWYYGDDYFYGTENEAKSHFLDLHSDELLSNGCDRLEKYIQVKVLRDKSMDMMLYEGFEILRHKLFRMNDREKEKLEEDKRKKSVENSSSEFFYVGRKSEYVGNSMVFWGKAGQGYTCYLDIAEVYSREDILKSWPWRDSDEFWPKESVDKATSIQVDMQQLKRGTVL